MDAKQNEFYPFVSFEGMVYATSLTTSALFGVCAGILTAYVLIPGPPLDTALHMAIVPYSASMGYVIVGVMRNGGEMKWKECLWAMLSSIFFSLVCYILLRLLYS